MEENKIDIYQIIGFLLLIAAFFWWFNVTIPDLEKSAQIENQSIEQEDSNDIVVEDFQDISEISKNTTKNPIGSNINQDIIIENDDVIFKFNTKGGLLNEVKLKGYSNHKGESLFIVNNNQKTNINFQTIRFYFSL